MEPKIIMRVKFVAPKNGAGLLDYQDRKEAVIDKRFVDLNKNSGEQVAEKDNTGRPNFYNYMDRHQATEIEDDVQAYNQTITNPLEKRLPTFNRVSDNITEKEKQYTKKLLKEADKSGANMWSIVLSFNDNFLKESGVIQNGILDQKKLKHCVRAGMSEFLQANDFNESAFYLANIHTNTTHVHVHIALSETRSSRQKINVAGKSEDRGKLESKMLRNGKAIFYKNIESPTAQLHEKNLLKEIDLIKSRALQNTRATFNDEYIKNIVQSRSSSNDKASTLILRLYQQLPSNKKIWRYNSNAKDFKTAKKTLDKLIDQVLVNSPEYAEFKAKLAQQDQNSRTAYGQNISHDVSQTKIKRLRSTIGNHFLKELKPLVTDGDEVKTIELKNQQLIEKISEATPEQLTQLDWHLTQMKDQLNQQLRSSRGSMTRKEFKEYSGVLNATQYASKKIQKMNATSISKVLAVQIHNIQDYLKTMGNADPQLNQQLTEILKQFQQQQESMKFNSMTIRQRREYQQKHHLTRQSIEAMRQQGMAQTGVTSLTDRSLADSSIVQLLQNELAAREQIIVRESPAGFQARTGEPIDSQTLKALKMNALNDNNTRKKYLNTRLDIINLRQTRQELFTALKQTAKGDPTRKELLKRVKLTQQGLSAAYKTRQALELTMRQFDKQATMGQVSDLVPSLKRPVIHKTTFKVPEEPDNQSRPLPDVEKQNGGKVAQLNNRLEGITSQLNRVLNRVSKATRGHISAAQHERYAQAIKHAEQSEEIEEKQESQSVELAAQREEIQAERDEAANRRSR